MTAAALAAILSARPSGRGRWTARCPGHDDRHPSLSIKQGERGVLVRCWSHGCTLEQITGALGIHVSDLFNDVKLTPTQRAEVVRQKAIREAERIHQRKQDRAACDLIFRLERIVNAIGAKLARSPDDRELGRLFHLASDKLHEAAATNEKRIA